jgi:hypothetical protein
MEYKLCASCKVNQPTSNFRWAKTRFESWCKECKSKHKKEWYRKNREYAIAEAKKYHYASYAEKREHKVKKAVEWVKNNPEKYKVNAKRCYEKTKLKRFAYQALARAKRRNAVPKWFDSIKEDVQKIYIEARTKTLETGIPHEVDHIIPLVSKYVCGLHVPNNLRVVTRYENRSKQNKLQGVF